MKHLNKISLLLLFVMLPMYGIAQSMGSMENISHIIGVFNVVVWITSAISIKQLIWPGDHNRSPYHVFNMVLVIAYLSIALSFLIHHKSYYEGYQTLTDMGCVKKYFFAFDWASLVKRVIEIGFICNIIYLIRFGREYYINSN